MRKKAKVNILLVLLLLGAQPARAYVDPGTTGLISQLAYLLFYAVLAGLGFFFRPLKSLGRAIFSRRRSARGPDSAAHD